MPASAGSAQTWPSTRCSSADSSGRDTGYLYLLLWVVPELTWHMFISRVRNIGEHGAVPDNNDRLRNTRTTHAGWFERALVAPYFVNYHLEHHLLVSCPCYRLPQAHALLIAKGFGPRMEIEAQLPRDAAPRTFETGSCGRLTDLFEQRCCSARLRSRHARRNDDA